MRLVSTTPQKIDKSNLWIIAIAEDSNKYYGAIVDPVTLKCYVEEVGVGFSKETLTGYFIRITDDEEWRAAVNFFEKHNVFNKFLEGRNWIWSKKNGKLTKQAEIARKRIII